MSESSLVDDCEAAVEQADSVTGSDVYLLKDPLLKDDDEPASSESLDAGSDDIESAETHVQKHRECCQTRHGLAITFAVVVAVFVVAAVIVVVVLSVTSLQGSVSWNPDTTSQSFSDVTSTVVAARKPVARVFVDESCMVNVEGVLEDGMAVFKGIRYAQAPKESLRWQRALPPGQADLSCESTVDASQFGSKCVQLDEDQSVIGNEDCLFVNIWTLASSESVSNDVDRGRAVLVFIHGGGLMTGSGHQSEAIPSAELLQELDAVIVSFNYRLNAFGFLTLESLRSTDGSNASGNYGFMDQILALQWVQRNIAAFGGNPNKVTVFGAGSGATSIYALLASSLTNGLFHRAWMSNPSPKFQNTRLEAEEQNAAFVNGTDCSADLTGYSSEADCLRALSSDAIVHALPWQQWLNNHFHKIPTVDEQSTIIATVDGYVLKEQPLLAWQKRTFHDVPLLIGSAAQATDDIKLNDWQQYNYVDYVQQRLASFEGIDSAQVFAMYGIDSPTAIPELCDTTLVSDIRATCPIDEMARVAANASRSSVYRYQITYHSPVRDSNTKNYAYRGIDIDAFFNSVHSLSDSWRQFSYNIRNVVGNFAQHGDIGNWLQFPRASYNISTVVSNATEPQFLSKQCDYWRNNAFFPEYAYMN